jgi:hypothetical protein
LFFRCGRYSLSLDVRITIPRRAQELQPNLFIILLKKKRARCESGRSPWTLWQSTTLFVGNNIINNSLWTGHHGQQSLLRLDI